jgi:hypothetical protein
LELPLFVVLKLLTETFPLRRQMNSLFAARWKLRALSSSTKTAVVLAYGFERPRKKSHGSERILRIASLEFEKRRRL